MYSTVTIINNTASHSFSAFSFIYLFRMYFRCIGSLLRCVGLSCCGAQVIESASSVVATRGLHCSVACGILYSSTRDQTCIPCIGRWILFFFFLEDGFLTTEPPGKSPDLNF